MRRNRRAHPRAHLRATWLWAAAALVAIATAVIVASDLAELHRRAETLGPQRSVVVAAHDLDLGASITADDLEIVRRHERQTAGWEVESTDALVGRTVARPVIEGAALSLRHVGPADRSGPDGVVGPGMRAVRIPDPQGLDPRPGSLVDVIVAFDPAAAEQLGFGTLTPVHAATVLYQSATDPAEPLVASGPADSILALVTADEAERLAFAAANGKVTLALAPPESARHVATRGVGDGAPGDPT